MTKTYLITGASSGIGLAAAKRLLKEGHNVIATYNSDNSSLKKINNPKLTVFKLNLGIENSIKVFVAKIKKVKLDGLVNNAGMNIPGSFDKINSRNWKKVNDVNLFGPFKLAQLLEKRFNTASSIINISSFCGQTGGPISSHYAVAKAGLISLTHNMAIHFSKRNIRVNCISPGLIDTKMAANAEKHPLYEQILLARVGKPSEVANTINFLLSDESSYITGQTINVNGGMLF
jgi:3-oxoacyl-[acyl-carrier protein] reductase